MEYNLGGNAFFLACYALLLIVQIGLGIRYRTWGFLFAMSCGLVLEILGYNARVLMHWGQENHFTMYIVTITIGPAFLSAGIYLCLARIIAVYGEHISRFKPRTYTITFMVSDFFALVLQAGGGSLAGNGDEEDLLNIGLAIMRAGLAFHLAAMCLFMILFGEFLYAVHMKSESWSNRFYDIQVSGRFKGFLLSLTIATLCILGRTAYRVAELVEGFQSPLAKNETLFMILEGAMVLLASLLLTIFHPGIAFHGRWAEANFSLKGRTRTEEKGESTQNVQMGLVSRASS